MTAQAQRQPEVITVPIGNVRPWDKNPRRVAKADFERLKQQILELGFYKALVATPDPESPGSWITIGGNTRLHALKDLGWTEVAISPVNAPTDDLKLKYTISDNDNVGAWDDQALAEIAFTSNLELSELDAFKIELGKPSRADSVINAFGPSPSSEEDAFPPPQGSIITSPGQSFTLGPHRLLCADPSSPNTITSALQGSKADLVFTSPYLPHLSPQFLESMQNDPAAEEAFLQFSDSLWMIISDSLKPGGAFYACCEVLEFPVFVYGLKKNHLALGSIITWVRPAAGSSRSDYPDAYGLALKGKRPRQASQIVYGWAQGRRYFFSSQVESSVWEVGRRASQRELHPGQRPLELVQRAIRNSSRPDELVFDPYAGAGSTLIAASREGRRAILVEPDPSLCDVIIRRWAAQGLQTEAEIRATVQAPADLGLAGPVRAERPRGKGKGRAQGDRPAKGQKQA